MAVHKLKHHNLEYENTTLTAVVVSEEDSLFLLDIGDTSITAKTAVSCLITPKAGDKVLCYLASSGSYILSVLESVAQENTHIKIGGSLIFETENNITFASNNFDLISRVSTNLYNDNLNIISNKTSLSFGDVKLNASKSVAAIDQNEIYSKSIDIVADRSTQRFRNCFKFVECIDQSHVGNLMQTVKNLFSSRSRQAIMLADQDVKIDGERIHIG